MVVSLTCEAIASEVGERNMFLEGPGLEWLAAQDAMEMNRADDGCRAESEKGHSRHRMPSKTNGFQVSSSCLSHPSPHHGPSQD